MRYRFLLVLLLFVCSTTLSAENTPKFLLENNDIVFGVGVSSDQEEADNYALISLSKTIKVRVDSRSTYAISSNGKSTNEKFEKESNVLTNSLLNDSSVYVSYDGKIYTIYRYIDKEKYITNHVSEYKKWIETAKNYLSSDSLKVKHADNLILGAYYMAYKSVDTELMNAICQMSENYKRMAFEGARSIYGKTRCGCNPHIFKREPYGIILYNPNEYFGYELMGIEIFEDGDGWKEPSTISEKYPFSETYPNQYSSLCKENYAIISVKSVENGYYKYRFTYEIIQDGILTKINPEEKWFFEERYLY